MCDLMTQVLSLLCIHVISNIATVDGAVKGTVLILCVCERGGGGVGEGVGIYYTLSLGCHCR